MKNEDFDRRVRAFFAAAPRPSAPDSVGRMPASPDGGEPGRVPIRMTGFHRARGLAGLGMAGLVVAVVVGIALSARSAAPNAGPVGPSASASASGSAGTRPPAAPVVAGSPYAMGGLTWQELGIGAFDGVESLALFPIDQGLLVVGTSRTAPVRLWLSTDGRQFQPLDAAAFATDDPAKQQVAVDGLVKGPAGYVAVGALSAPKNPDGVYGTPAPLVWRSEDGLHWSRVTAQGLPAGGLTAIAAVSGGYVVALEPTQTGTGMVPYLAYFSADGNSWQATPVVATVVVGREGHVVATTIDSAVAVTDDGKDWTTLHPAKQVVTVEAAPEGFIAIAYDQATTRMSVSRSADGRTWTSAVEISADWANGMTYAMGRWVMVGPAPTGWNSATLLTSADAVAWRSSAIPAEVVGDAMLGGHFYPFGDGLLAVTQTESCCGKNLSEYGPLQVHLWWVRASLAGDAPGSTVPPEPTAAPTPSGGIGEQQALAIASARYPVTMTEPYAKLVTIGGFDPKQTLVPQDRLVWLVMVVVPKPGCSGKAPGPSPCDLPYTSLAVIVDYMSGDIIEVVDTNR